MKSCSFLILIIEKNFNGNIENWYKKKNKFKDYRTVYKQRKKKKKTKIRVKQKSKKYLEDGLSHQFYHFIRS